MSTVVKIYTPEQIIKQLTNKIISDNVGLTSFNSGDALQSMLEAYATLSASQQMDFVSGVRTAMRLGTYSSLKFPKKGALNAIGFTRYYRKPIFTLRYTGGAGSCKITIDATNITLTTASANIPGDDHVIPIASYTTAAALVAYLSTLTHYSATLVGDGGTLTSTLYQHSAQEIVGQKNYRNQTGFDLMPSTATAVPIGVGIQTSSNNIVIITTASGAVPAGMSSSAPIASQSYESGDINITSLMLDTLNGKGYVITPITGVEHAINDVAFAPGRTIESDAEYSKRFIVYISGLSIHNKYGIEDEVMKLDRIKSVTVLPNIPHAGTNTIVADDGTGDLSVDQINLIQKVLDGDPNDLTTYPGALACGINSVVKAPDITAVPASVTLYKHNVNADNTEIILAAQTAIEQYINTRKLGEPIIVSELITRIKDSHPEIYDVVIVSPSSNLVIGTSNLARTGGIIATVTITGPILV